MAVSVSVPVSHVQPPPPPAQPPPQMMLPTAPLPSHGRTSEPTVGTDVNITNMAPPPMLAHPDQCRAPLATIDPPVKMTVPRHGGSKTGGLIPGPTLGRYQCSHCGKRWISPSQLATHERTHTGEKPYECGSCGKKFSNRSNLVKHERTHTKPFVCRICGNRFSQASHLAKHLQCHGADAKPTPEASSAVATAAADVAAVSGGLPQSGSLFGKQSEEAVYRCKFCDERCVDATDLAAHEATHTGDKPYKCKVCVKVFSNRTDRKTHERIHTGEKPYECSNPNCNKRFTTSSHKARHERMHKGDKLYSCPQCDKKFTTKCQILPHLRTHSGEKPYKCNYCSRRFTQRSNRKTHERIHTGEKPFECAKCDKRFSQSSSLTLHERTHTGEKPYTCSHCAKKFSSCSNLAEHERTHTKPFVCGICSKRYPELKALANHHKALHPDVPVPAFLVFKADRTERQSAMTPGDNEAAATQTETSLSVIAPQSIVTESSLRSTSTVPQQLSQAPHPSLLVTGAPMLVSTPQSPSVVQQQQSAPPVTVG